MIPPLKEMVSTTDRYFNHSISFIVPFGTKTITWWFALISGFWIIIIITLKYTNTIYNNIPVELIQSPTQTLNPSSLNVLSNNFKCFYDTQSLVYSI